MRKTVSNRSHMFYGNTRWFVRDYVNKNKIILIIFSFFVLLSVLTGVLTAVKNIDSYSLVNFDDHSLSKFLSGDLGTSELFFSRMGSYVVSIAVIIVMGFSVFLSPFSICVVVYRGYLLGINCTFLITLFGLGGAVSSLLVVFPCQLAILLMLGLFAIIVISRAKFKRKYGYKCQNNRNNNFVLCFLFIVAITLVNLVETVLLSVFSNRIILVI